MKDSRISKALGYIGDDISREAIEEFDKKSAKIDSTVPEEKPRVIRDEKSHKAPFMIALAGLCAAAAIAAPLVLRNVGNSPITSNNVLSGAAASAPKVEKLGYNLDGAEDYREYKFEFTMPEYEGVAFECAHNKITANGEVIASGLPILEVYLADLDSNGRREIVSRSTFGSGILTTVISACDYSEKQPYIYMFSNNGLGNYLELFENNGELWVRETEYRTKNVLSEKKLELSDMKKIDEITQSEEKPYSQQELTGENMTVKVDRLKLSHNGRELTADLDNENPNVNFVTVRFDKSKSNQFAIVVNEDGTFSTFTGEDASEENALAKCPDGKFGIKWNAESIGGKCEWILPTGELIASNISSIRTDGNVYTYQFWFATSDEVEEYWKQLTPNGGELHILDNGYGTYEVYLSLTDDSGISVNVKEVKITLTDDKQLSVRDDENPNARIFTINLDKSKAKVQAFVINKDGTYRTFSGDDITKEDILRECPDGVSGVMWSSYTKTESSLFDGEGSNPAFNGTFEYKGNDLWSYEYWYSDDEEVKRACWDYGFDESGYPLRLKDNGDGTYTVYPDVP